MENCPICGTSLNRFEEKPNGRRVNLYECPRCGDFGLSSELVTSIERGGLGPTVKLPRLSHALRMMQDSNDGDVTLNLDEARRLIQRPLPDVAEQADLMIRWLAENVDGPGELAEVRPVTHGGIIGSKSPAGFTFVLNHLADSGLVQGSLVDPNPTRGHQKLTLTFDGWRYYNELRRGRTTYRTAFMAMPFGMPDLDRIVDEVFRPAVEETGFKLFRLDDYPKAGLIDDRLRVEIQSSDFLIADLTHSNEGAYWEAGYAEGLGKPVIYTCEKSIFEKEQTHFDTNHHLTIIWDPTNRERIAEDLMATIRATLPERAKR